jgi:hypothetical protein
LAELGANETFKLVLVEHTFNIANQQQRTSKQCFPETPILEIVKALNLIAYQYFLEKRCQRPDGDKRTNDELIQL